MVLGLIWIARSHVAWCVRLQQFSAEMIVPLFAGSSAAELALVSLCAGVGEELLFRGLVQSAVGHWISPGVGLLVAGLLFGLAHPLSIAYAVLATLAGIYLGGLFLACDNLLVPIVTHAVYDFLALLYLLRQPRAAELGPVDRS